MAAADQLDTVADPAATQPVLDATVQLDALLQDDLTEQVDSAESSSYGELSGDGFVLDRLEARQTFQDYLESSHYHQAVDAGELMVRLTEQEFGPNNLEMAPVLNDLGVAMSKAGRPAEAAPHFERSVAIYQDKIGIFAPEMVDPLTGLGLAQQLLGSHDDAQNTFQRAQHLIHRDRGVNNLDQLPIVQARAQSFLAQDKLEEAENLQLLSFKLYRRNYGKGTIATIPAMHTLANFYNEISEYRQARTIYRQTLELLEEQDEKDTPAMVPALIGISESYLQEHASDMYKGLLPRERIVAIADGDPDYDIEDRILAHLELGDWYVVFNAEQKAWEQYRIAWDLSVEREADLIPDWRASFDRPHLIYPGAVLSLDLMGYGVVNKEVYYDFQFTIARDGRPTDINILATNLHGQTRSAALHAFRYARFRPRVVDGSTVATEGYRVRRVYPTDPPEGYQALKLKVTSSNG